MEETVKELEEIKNYVDNPPFMALCDDPEETRLYQLRKISDFIQEKINTLKANKSNFINTICENVKYELKEELESLAGEIEEIDSWDRDDYTITRDITMETKVTVIKREDVLSLLQSKINSLKKREMKDKPQLIGRTQYFRSRIKGNFCEYCGRCLQDGDIFFTPEQEAENGDKITRYFCGSPLYCVNKYADKLTA